MAIPNAMFDNSKKEDCIMSREYLKKAIPQIPEDMSEVVETVAKLISEVREKGDSAVRLLTKKFDNIDLEKMVYTEEDFNAAEKAMPVTLKEDMDFGFNQVTNFAKAQFDTISEFEKEVGPGIHMGHRIIPISSVGAYIPGGRYPILSAPPMLICPAKVAGVSRIVACTPPRRDGKLHPATLYAIKRCGADECYCVGGVQAIAAMAYGTETIRPVDKIVGPGNKWVTEAKRQVNGVVGLDLQAGPSEILVLADKTGQADIIAADLLGQLEHDPNARGVLVTNSRELGEATIAEVERQVKLLATCETASTSWKNHGEVVITSSMEEACDFANEWAPEHLEIHCKHPDVMLSRLHNYGSCFVGVNAAEVFADKVSGTNHTLPTGRAARYTGGVWVGTFLKWITHQGVDKEAMKLLAHIVYRQSTIEGMVAHAESAAIRLRKVGEPVD